MEVEKLYSASAVLQRMMGSVVLGAVLAVRNSFVLLLFLSGALPCDTDVFPHPSEMEKRFLFDNIKKDAVSEESKNLGECVDDEDDEDNDDDDDDDDDVDGNDDDEDDSSGEGSDTDDGDADSDNEVQANGDGGSDEEEDDDEDDESGDDDDSDDEED